MFNSKSSTNLAVLLCIMTLISNLWGFKLLPLVLPDSESYLAFTPNRTSFYPLFLDFFSIFTESLYPVVLLQIIIYLITYFFLLRTVHLEFKSLSLTLIFGLSIGSNFYLQSFNSSIVSESLVFSIINLIIICLTKTISATRDNILIIISWLGLLTGILFGLKPSMITFIPTLFVIILLFSSIKSFSVLKLTIIFFTPIILFVALEGVVHKFYHEKKSSFLGKLMFGKATLIMTNYKAEVPTYLTDRDTIRLIKVKELVEPIKKYRGLTTDGLKVKALMPRIEVFGQYKVSPILEKNFGFEKENSTQMMRIGKAVIRSNFILYIKTSLSYFLSFWYVNEVTSPFIFKDIENNLFNSDFLNEIVPEEKPPLMNLLSCIAFFAFFIISFLSLLFSVLSWILTFLLFVKGTKTTLHFHMVFIGSLFFLVQTNLLFVSFINIPMARYLMPLFPMFMLAILLFFHNFFVTFKNYKKNLSDV